MENLSVTKKKDRIKDGKCKDHPVTDAQDFFEKRMIFPCIKKFPEEEQVKRIAGDLNEEVQIAFKKVIK